MNKNKRYKYKVVNKVKMFIVLTAVVLVAIATLGTTLAYLSDRTDPIANIFNPSNMNINIEEEFENDVKTDVKVQNTGDTTAYIRAKIVVTWKNAEPGAYEPDSQVQPNGDVYPVAPVAGADYTITLNETDWVQIGGFWYHKAPVAGNAETAVLITKCEPVAANTPEGYGLNVEILSQSIQSEPTDVVVNSWKVTLDENGVITAGGVK